MSEFAEVGLLAFSRTQLEATVAVGCTGSSTPGVARRVGPREAAR